MKRPADYYDNVYGTPEYLALREKYAYVEAPEYFEGCETVQLSESVTVEIRSYRHAEPHIVHAELDVCTVFRSGEAVYSFRQDGGHVSSVYPLLRHSSGRVLLPFHEDLCGISFLDIDTLETVHYVPRGMMVSGGQVTGESFIVTGVHYDPQTDLIAYDGCFWACPADVMAGDFSDPMHFDPHLVSLCELIDGGEDLDGGDFLAWENGVLVMKGDDKREYRFAAEEIRRALGEHV